MDHHHDSTFCLYRRDAFETARELFIERLLDVYPDPEDIFWTDYNLMLVAEKQ